MNENLTPSGPEAPESESENLQARQSAIMEKLSAAYEKKLDDEMGKLNNQIVGFIAATGLPLPQALLVIEMVRKEIITQAHARYLGGD